MITTFTIAVYAPPNGASVTANLFGNPSQSRSGGTSASASSGSGGWQVTDRSRQKASTEWLDYYPMVMTFTCLLDGGPGLVAASVEPQIAILESFEVPAPGTYPPLPPILTISGPVAHTDLQWVCSRLTFPDGEDAAIRDPNTGERTQQGFVIELTEYSPSLAITALSPAQQAAASSLISGTNGGSTTVPGASSYTVAAGDTLQSIAAAQLGNVAQWTQIALINGFASSQILTPGQSILLPAPQG